MNMRSIIMDNTSFQISDEQIEIINSPNNLIINSVAGSGKTTTILYKAIHCPDKFIFQLTYNKMLKDEVRKKTKLMEINNLEIHNYHSLAVTYYSPLAYKDEMIAHIILQNYPLIVNIARKIDYIIIDEAQDMTLTYLNFIKKFLIDTENENAIIWVMGDKLQTINEFKGANFMFLTKANNAWNRPFQELHLTTSFRMTIPIVSFINKVMYGDERIKSFKAGERVMYYIGNPFEIYKTIGQQIVKQIKRGNLLPDDIFIVSPSIKSANAPFIKLENYLVLHGVPCFVPTCDDAILSNDIINGKIVCSSIHQTKGRERKWVIAYCFDESYFKYYSKNTDQMVCPNALYVLVSRAKEKLILIHDEKYKMLPFLKMTDPKFTDYVEFIDLRERRIIPTAQSSSYNPTKKYTTVTELVKFINDDSMGKILPLMESLFFTIQNGNNVADIPTKISFTVRGKTTMEDVSEINGIVIPSMYEKKDGNVNMSFIEEYLSQFVRGITDANLNEYAKKLVLPCVTIRDYLFSANFYVCATMGIYSKLAQIKSYNWLKKSQINTCFKNMEILNGKKIKYEIDISNAELPYKNIVITGRMDAMCDEIVYEFKCVGELSVEHKLQILIYEWLYRIVDYNKIYGKKHFVLLNIRTGEMLQVNKNKENKKKIDEIVDILITGKFMVKSGMNEDEFLDLVKEK